VKDAPNVLQAKILIPSLPLYTASFCPCAPVLGGLWTSGRAPMK